MFACKKTGPLGNRSWPGFLWWEDLACDWLQHNKHSRHILGVHSDIISAVTSEHDVGKLDLSPILRISVDPVKFGLKAPPFILYSKFKGGLKKSHIAPP